MYIHYRITIWLPIRILRWFHILTGLNPLRWTTPTRASNSSEPIHISKQQLMNFLKYFAKRVSLKSRQCQKNTRKTLIITYDQIPKIKNFRYLSIVPFFTLNVIIIPIVWNSRAPKLSQTSRSWHEQY